MNFITALMIIVLAALAIVMTELYRRERSRTAFRNLIIGAYYLRYGPLDGDDKREARS